VPCPELVEGVVEVAWKLGVLAMEVCMRGVGPRDCSQHTIGGMKIDISDQVNEEISGVPC
jgi:hypothetical protein